MSEKVFNHEVTAGLLRGWCSKDAHGKEGLWHWDLSSKNSKPTFEEGKKAKFAGVDFLYVGENKEQPLRVDIEDGLATHENHLVRFTQKLWDRSIANDEQGVAMAQRALSGILGFDNRGAWNITELSRQFNLHDEQRLKFIEEQFTAVMNSFSHWDFVFFKDTSAPLLICDAPLFDLRLGAKTLPKMSRNIVIMPLGPRAAVLGTKSNREGSPKEPKNSHWTESINCKALDIQISISEAALTPQMTNCLNNFTLHRARRWIAATTENQLSTHAAFLQPDKLQQRIKKDSMIMTNLKNLSVRCALDDTDS